jgi:formamidopyrimidine-DNA glycosylase
MHSSFDWVPVVPELPDIVAYVEALEREIVGCVLNRAEVRGVSALKTFDPPIDQVEGLSVTGIRRMGKRLVLIFEDNLFLTVHLMIAGRLFWKKVNAKSGRDTLLVLRFDHGALFLRELAKKETGANLASSWRGITA